MIIPCQNCRKQYPTNWNWHVCDKCGFRICQACLGNHKGPHSSGGFKCSQCPFGRMEQKR